MAVEDNHKATSRLALLQALGIERENTTRDAYAAFEALAEEVLTLRQDNVELQHALESAENLADRDALCPLFNRRAFMRELNREIASAERYQIPLSLIYVDLDRFKLVNDRFGHATGDKVLQLVSTIILEHIRQTDIPARLGGDEFAILLTHAEYHDAVRKAQIIEAHLNTLIVRDSEASEIEPVKLGASCGTVAWSRGMDAARLVDTADERMFVAKSKRKRGSRKTNSVPQKENHS